MRKVYAPQRTKYSKSILYIRGVCYKTSPMLIISTSKSTSIGAWLRNNGLVWVKHEDNLETKLWNDKCWTREATLLQNSSNGSERRNRKQSKSCWQISRQRRESSYLQVWTRMFFTTKTFQLSFLQMEVFAVEVDLERAACLHWHVHGDIHGVSVMTKLIG